MLVLTPTDIYIIQIFFSADTVSSYFGLLFRYRSPFQLPDSLGATEFSHSIIFHSETFIDTPFVKYSQEDKCTNRCCQKIYIGIFNLYYIPLSLGNLVLVVSPFFVVCRS